MVKEIEAGGLDLRKSARKSPLCQFILTPRQQQMQEGCSAPFFPQQETEPHPHPESARLHRRKNVLSPATGSQAEAAICANRQSKDLPSCATRRPAGLPATETQFSGFSYLSLPHLKPEVPRGQRRSLPPCSSVLRRECGGRDGGWHRGPPAAPRPPARNGFYLHVLVTLHTCWAAPGPSTREWQAPAPLQGSWGTRRGAFATVTQVFPAHSLAPSFTQTHSFTQLVRPLVLPLPIGGEYREAAPGPWPGQPHPAGRAHSSPDKALAIPEWA